jgi:hypothetical protein
MEKTLDKAAGIAGRLAGGAVKTVGGIVDFLASPPPKTTEQERADAAKLAETKAARRARLLEEAEKAIAEQEKQAREQEQENEENPPPRPTTGPITGFRFGPSGSRREKAARAVFRASGKRRVRGAVLA